MIHDIFNELFCGLLHLRKETWCTILTIASKYVIDRLKESLQIERLSSDSLLFSSVSKARVNVAASMHGKDRIWICSASDSKEFNINAGEQGIYSTMRKLAYRAGILHMTPCTYEYIASIFCDCIHGLLHFAHVIKSSPPVHIESISGEGIGGAQRMETFANIDFNPI